ncbi:MAG: ABC transporter permease [Planctomycetota bacterium]
MNSFKKIAGVAGLLLFTLILAATLSDSFLSSFNIENLIRRSSLIGILSIGVAFVIITGGIDLSIGSVVCLVGCLTPFLITKWEWHPALALAAMALLSLTIGLTHGLLITKLRLQPFIVTLCGLLIYRGITRGLVADQTQGFAGGFKGLRWVAKGQIDLPGLDFGLPVPAIVLVVLAAAAIYLLNYTVWGRYMMAIGQNEKAALYSGISTDRVTILAYVICSLIAGVGGVLYVFDFGSAQPVDFGNFFELYAIAGAVLGGCSLRGGEGTIIGVIIGAAVMQVLKNMITLVDFFSSSIEYAVIGVVILMGVMADEAIRRFASRK